MTPEELATLFKRRGDFDSTRKDLLVDFQNSDVGQQFTLQLDDILQECIDKDSTLLQREKSEFHQLMVERITKSSEYKKVQQFVDSLLQPAQYMSKIESKLRTIVQEQAPPESAAVEETSSSKSTSAPATFRSAKESKEPRESKGSKIADRNGSDSTIKRESALSAQPETSLQEVKEKSIRIKEEADVNAEGNNPDSTKTSNGRDAVSGESSSRKVAPRKRKNRRLSMDSNSSLSSPPSSSDQDSDRGSRGKEGRRAKKLSKKAAHRDKMAVGEPNDESADFVDNSISSKVDSIVRTDDDTAMDVSADALETKKVDESTRMDVDLKTTMAESKQSESKSTNDNEVEPPSEKTESIQKAGRDSSSEKSHRDHSHKQSPLPSTSTLPIRSPAATGANSVSVLRRRESDSVDKKLPRDLSHGHGAAHKRIPHQPLPLPPRPMAVPLPPKPTPKPSIPRRPSHSRSTSSTGGTITTGSVGTGNSPSSTAASSLSPVSSTPPSSSSSNRFGGRFKSDLDNHVPLHPSLPPPPLNLQHPLPPPPRLGLSGSRSQSHTSKTPAVIGSPPSNRTPPSTTAKPRLSTSHSEKSTTEIAPTGDSLTTASSTMPSTISGAEEKTGATQEPTVESNPADLKSPDANGSSGSLSANGSLASSTGSLSTDASGDKPLPSSALPSEETPSTLSKLGVSDITATGKLSAGEESAMETETLPSPVAPQPEPPVTPPAVPAPPPPPTPPPQSSTGSDAGSSEEGALMESPPLRPISPVANTRASDGIPSSKPDTSAVDPSNSHKSPPRAVHPTSSSPSPSASSPSSSGHKARPPPATTSGTGASSTPSASLSSTPGSGRAPIPLPHKPIPLPPKPSGASTGSGASGAGGGHGRHHHHHGGAGHRKYRH